MLFLLSVQSLFQFGGKEGKSEGYHRENNYLDVSFSHATSKFFCGASQLRLLSLYGPWPYGPIFLLQEFWEIDEVSHFSISNSKGVYHNFFWVLKQAPLLIKYPTLKVREHLTSPPPAPPLPRHKNFDVLLDRIA